ncbi:hypothetical protein GCM10017083_39710 [Thalassobaculum fulvum]|uniref:N-ATPase, AtpR subunit n=1 Tax=Thalassobaculum fulvum TaxID=1633335 RepID=A0A918XUQ7_9PROT|nr:ATP synthase subunit I [Thalassobaculum fulvum]GHD57800.1 hypothetical protein GCM10017083_39710 [Thalassobaculum fulvum]
MIDQMTVQTAVELLVAGVAGFGLGRLYFMAVRRTAELYGSASDWRLPVVLTAGRVLAAAAGFALAAQFGAGPLLAAFLGFLAARRLAVRGARGEAA